MNYRLYILSLALLQAACQPPAPQQVDTTDASVDNPVLEEVFADSTYQLTGVAATPDGRLFTNYPYWRQDRHRYSVVEVKNGKPVPYPDSAWNSFKKGEDGKKKFVCVQAVVADDKGFLWIVDPAGIGLGPVYQHSSKVVKVNLANNQVDHIYYFPDSVTATDSYINDIRIDNQNGFAYMTSSSNGGIVVLNIKTGAARFVLHNSPSVRSDPSFEINFNGKEFRKADGSLGQINSDGIALSPDKSFLYYKPLTDNKLYRIHTSLLRNFTIPQRTLEDSVQTVGHFVTTDGMEFDSAGNLYMGDLESSSIVRLRPDYTIETVVSDTSRLIWPDSYSIANGYLYISASQIQLSPNFNNNVDCTQYPFRIFRVKI